HFYAQAPTELGMSAASYRQGGQLQRITFATGPCPLGRVLMAQSDAGVCAILLGDSDEELERDLRARFAKAECVADNTLGEHLAAVVALIETPHSAPPLPLDIRGTAFQRRVWQALQAIPPGQTRSYSELAHAVGTPSAARAVAGACAANPLAIAVPCHRIVRSDGSLSGYRWGVERKRALLQREALDTADD
ncbi:MAG TPA: bifunctional transcriptional activator/DNA repair enzyme protein Ada, partial [Pseudomonas sp.]|nr:bifunctional transcriptional activator/DNA repair enzyme protein Ada [Pseudomonas sp.]